MSLHYGVDELGPQVTGFQAAGGIAIIAQYRGPDTGGQLAWLRSVDADVPTDDTTAGGWTVQLYAVEQGTEYTPPSFPSNTLIGQSSVVPYLLFNR